MILTFACTVAGFVVVFVKKGEYSKLVSVTFCGIFFVFWGGGGCEGWWRGGITGKTGRDGLCTDWLIIHINYCLFARFVLDYPRVDCIPSTDRFANRCFPHCRKVKVICRRHTP